MAEVTHKDFKEAIKTIAMYYRKVTQRQECVDFYVKFIEPIKKEVYLREANCAIFDAVARCIGKTTVGKLKEPLVLETTENNIKTDVVIPKGCFVEVSSEDNYPHKTTDKDIEEAVNKLNEG